MKICFVCLIDCFNVCTRSWLCACVLLLVGCIHVYNIIISDESVGQQRKLGGVFYLGVKKSSPEESQSMSS